MKNKLFILYQYLLYRLRSKTTHGTHSPFVFQLLNNVIYNDRNYYAYTEIETYRQELRSSKEQIVCIDFGAGGTGNEIPLHKKISTIAKRALKPSKYGQLLFRLIHYYEPETILELGTSLGVTTCYLAAPSSKHHVITLEGCPEAITIAKKNWIRLGYKNISAHVGNFNTTLPAVLKKTQKLDFVFFDGNHRKEPTLAYFRQCMEKSHENTVFVMDDIHWSMEMKCAWDVIKKDDRVAVTIDLFFMGLVFFHKGQAKQHFVIRF